MRSYAFREPLPWEVDALWFTTDVLQLTNALSLDSTRRSTGEIGNFKLAV